MTLYLLFLRILIIWVGFRGDEVLLVGLAYSLTFQNIFCAFVMFGTINVISTEVSKCVSAGSVSSVPKVLQYALIFSLSYITLIFLPLTYFSEEVLQFLTDLPSEVLKITKQTNYLTFGPMMLSCTYFSISTYFQALGLGAKLGRYNMMFGIAAVFVVVTYIIITDDIYNGYVLFTWLVPALQFMSSIYLYFKILLPGGRISSLKIEFKDFFYIVSRIFGNVIVEVTESLDTELVVIFSSHWLSTPENRAFNFSFQIFFLSIFAAVPFVRLIYCAFSEFLGANQPKLARNAYMLTSFIYWITTVLLCFVFMALYPLATNFALKESIEARSYLPELLLCCLAGKFTRTHLTYTFEMMKGLDLRVTSIVMLLVKHATLAGTCWVLVEKMDMGGRGLYLGFFGCNLATDIFGTGFLVFLNWEKKLNKLRLL